MCSKFMFTCPPFTRTHALKLLRHCTIAAVMMKWSSSLHSLSTRSFNSFTSLIYERWTLCWRIPKMLVVHRIQIRWIEWSHLWVWTLTFLSLRRILMKCLSWSVNGMISLTSTLCHQVRDAGDTNVVNLPVSSVYSLAKLCTRNHEDPYKLFTKNEWHLFYFDTVYYWWWYSQRLQTKSVLKRKWKFDQYGEITWNGARHSVR